MVYLLKLTKLLCGCSESIRYESLFCFNDSKLSNEPDMWCNWFKNQPTDGRTFDCGYDCDFAVLLHNCLLVLIHSLTMNFKYHKRIIRNCFLWSRMLNIWNDLSSKLRPQRVEKKNSKKIQSFETSDTSIGSYISSTLYFVNINSKCVWMSFIAC